MDDELAKPYKKIAAAEELIEANSLLDLYIDMYKRKYKTEPIFNVTRAHTTQIKDLQRLTKGQGRVFISEYFQMRDDWFHKQQYSLDCLIRNLNKVAVAVKKREAHVDLKGKMIIQIICDSCHKELRLYWPMDSTFVTKTVRCEVCERENRPGMVVRNKKINLSLPTVEKGGQVENDE